MAEEQLSEILDAMRARIQAQVEAQIQALNARHEEALAKLRSEAESEAERRWTSKVDAVRNEWSARLQSEVAAARTEAEQRFVAEAMRAKVEAEQAATEATARARRELDQAVAAERQRAAAELDDERRRAEHELQQTVASLEAERQQLETERQQRQAEDAAQPQPAGADARALLEAIATIDEAPSLSDALAALVWAAVTHAPRVALFVVNGTHLDEWSVAGVRHLSPLPIDVESGDAGLLGAAMRSGQKVTDGEAPVPAFANLPRDAGAMAIPLMLGGQPVAVLYADDGTTGTGQQAGWMDSVELLARHAAACLAELTAVRALQVLQGDGNGAHGSPQGASRDDEDQSAKRYARLLVSEIKLYNEAAVRLGREKRDLLQRLEPEIDRARRLYEERVPPTVAARGAYFHQELVQTLAGGDAALLG